MTSYTQLDSPFELPFIAEPFFVPSAGDRNEDSKDEPIANTNATTSCRNTDLTDGLASKYYLGEGKTSPYGKWKNVYSGNGATYFESADPINNAFYLKPKAVTYISQTEAALVRKPFTFCNYVAEFDMNTINQLRQGSPSNTWEAGWFIFRYTDMSHHYWLLIRSDGFEFVKKDCNICLDTIDGQKYLVTKSSPTLKINTWQHWKITTIGNHLEVWIDNQLIVNFVDKGMSSQLAGGNIAMYSEDVHVKFDNFKLRRM